MEQCIMTKHDFVKNNQEIENYYFFRSCLTDEEIMKVLQIAETKKEIDGRIGTDPHIEESYRNSKIKWLSNSNETKWLFDKFGKLVKIANNSMWNFDIVGFGEKLQVGTYISDNKGHYDWHIDCDSSTSFRKISMSIQLSDPNDYEGGELQLFTKKTIATLPKDKGTVIFFPSFLLHRVTPVTKGKRISLVAWITGPQFK